MVFQRLHDKGCKACLVGKIPGNRPLQIDGLTIDCKLACRAALEELLGRQSGQFRKAFQWR